MSDLSFARIYDEHVWDVYGFFGYRVASRVDAEDLTQLTFERALRALRRFDPQRGTPRTWLLAIARNLLIDHYRTDRRAREEPLPAGFDNQDLVAAAPETSLGIGPELETALAGLGERERELIALRFGGDLTGPEIAELTGLSLANVQQIISRSLRRLRVELEDDSRHVETVGTNAYAASGPSPANPTATTASKTAPEAE
jgi:RNA polymerase sigma factor (sigma-70 family)